ncbi:MAG: hypothetical protein MUC87_11620 [Bacteroidia bacterium]|jgi:hypothetical protein|nr:hypothetical protein [Bacteroidia bacterium]
MSNSFDFDFADKIGYESPWKKEWENKSANSLNFKNKEQKTVSFTPNITLECGKLKNLPVNTQVLLRFTVEGKSEQSLFESDYDVTFSCSNKNVTLTTKSVEVEKGWTILTNIISKKEGNASIEIKVDGVWKNTVNLNFLSSKDIFTEGDIIRQINEFKYIKKLCDTKPPPHKEYDENYCMQAAERGLSELLNDTVNFYSVYRKTHKHKNNIGFAGKTAYDRGDFFEKKGFVESIITFDSYTINHNEKKAIFESKNATQAEQNYAKYIYSIISLTKADEKKLQDLILDEIKEKETGFHVFYFTVTGGFHTLTLIIDNLFPCDPSYQIWDQHGLSSSHGKLDELAMGIATQTSWTFANTCLNRYKSGNTKYYDSTETKLWKIRRK